MFFCFGGACCKLKKEVPKIREELDKMSELIDTLNAKVAELNDRDDKIVQAISDLNVLVKDLQDQIANTENPNPAIQAAVDQIAESVAKFDAVLTPA